jgi:hypothetical protein
MCAENYICRRTASEMLQYQRNELPWMEMHKCALPSCNTEDYGTRYTQFLKLHHVLCIFNGVELVSSCVGPTYKVQNLQS